MDDILEYRTIIERFARDRIDARVPNGLPQHASILIETMFRSATAEIRIFSRELDEKVFGSSEIKNAVIKFISNKPYANLKILLQKNHDEKWINNHFLVNAIKQIDGLHGRVEIRNAAGSYAKDDTNHFAVMDNDGFRFELDHDNCKAVANFNEPKTAKKLITAFDEAFKISRENFITPLFELNQSS